MFGLMQDAPLLVSQTLAHAARVFPETEIASAEDGRVVHRTTYSEADGRARRLASALHARGLVGEGVFLGALAWNAWRLFEVMHAVPGAGSVLHTANPRLHERHLAYTINLCEDRAVFVDPDCLPLAEAVAPGCPTVRHWILLADRSAAPTTALPGVLYFEDLVREGDPDFVWPDFDERRASTVCFTSATTGEPKGALYSHRGTVLNVLTLAGKNGWSLGKGDCVLCAAPFFHCNGWGMPYLAPLTGAKMVLPGRSARPRAMLDLFHAEGVTHSGGVPTVLLDLLAEAQQSGRDFGDLQRLWTGATAPPEALLRRLEALGPEVVHAFGMTETTHALTVSIPDPNASPSARRAEQMTQGQPVFLSDIRSVDEDGQALPADGESVGRLQARGPAVAAGYFKRPDLAPMTADGWFDTGDIGAVGPGRRMRITDRAKDAIKSGGEWISSIEIENLAAGCPGVAEACCIGVDHARWQERPVLLIVRERGAELDKQTVLAWLDGKIAKWQTPDEVCFVDSLPRNGVGKVMKATLRDAYRRLLTDGHDPSARS